MDYSQAYSEDMDVQWEDFMASAEDHLERLLADLTTDVSKLGESVPFPNCTPDWYFDCYQRRLEQAKDVARFISKGDAFGYAERFIGDFSDNGDY